MADQRLVEMIMSGGGAGANLLRANLEGTDLYQANLAGANLQGADLKRADLYGANFRGADLYGANFTGANLNSAILRGANLKRADLSGANLSRAILNGADLTGAKLRGANLKGVNYDAKTIWPLDFPPPGGSRMASRGRTAADKQLIEMIMSGRGAGANLAGESFMGTNLRGADFRRTNLEGAVFQIANLVAADFRGVNLAYADFIDADLSSADLRRADLEGAHLQGAILNGADLTGADLRYANLQYANFSRANLNGADLTGAKKIENAILKGVKYDSNTVWPDGFTPPSGGRMASRASQGGRKAAISRDLVPSITLNGSDPSRLIEEVSNTRELLREAERSMYRPHGRDWFDNFREAALVTGKFMAAMYDYVELCNHVEMAARNYLDSKSKFSRSASGSNRLSRFEEGVPADPTENMSPEDAAEWEEMNEKYGDKFKKASYGSRYAAGKIVAREPYMRALQRMQDAFDRSGGDPVKLYDAIDRRVRATRELGKLQGIYDAIIFDVMRGTFGPVPRFLDVRYKALLDQLQQVLRVSRSF